VPGRTQIIIACLLVCAAAAAVGAENDIVPRAEELYSRGEYLRVIDFLETNLRDTMGFTAEETVVLRRLLGSSYVAVGNVESAKVQFKKILSIDPEVHMDPLSTSPKIVSVFHEAKAEFQAENSHVPPDTAAPSLVRFKHREGVWVGPALKSLLLPGLGQLQNGDEAKGIIFMSSEVLSVAGLVVSHVWYDEARKEYAANTDPEKMASLYDEYNRWYMMRNGFIATSVGICVVSSVDAIVGAYEREIAEGERTMGLIPIQGGVYAYLRF